MDAATELADWLSEPDTQAAIERCVQRAIASLEAEIPVRSPESDIARRQYLDDWLAAFRSKFAVRMDAEFRSEFPSLATRLHDGLIADLIHAEVWPRVETFLRAEDARAQAALWVNRHIGDAVTIGWPERTSDGWRVPLGLAGRADPIGAVILTPDGTVLPARTMSRHEILEALRGDLAAAP